MNMFSLLSKGSPGSSNPGEGSSSVESERKKDLKLSDRKFLVPLKMVGKSIGGKKAPCGKEAVVCAAPMGGSGLPPSLLDPLATYRFKLVQSASVNSSVGGVIAANFSADPGTTSFLEWSSLTALFSEVRLVRATLSISPFNPHSDAMASTDLKYAVRNFIACTWDDQLVNSVPASFSAVVDNARVWYVHLGSPTVQELVAPVSQNRSYAPTGTASPGPYAGCTGQFSCYAGNSTVSYHYFDWVYSGEYEFRNRI